MYLPNLPTDCSSLNHHLYSKNTTDSPLCTCGRIETNKHYLFECNRFNEFRQKMMQGISPLCNQTSDTLLYGNRELSSESNEHIFTIVQAS